MGVATIDLAVATGIMLLGAVPRLLNLGLFMTADEKNWIGRSYEFIRAFLDFRFNDMLQTTHPGVTALWTIGSAVFAKAWLSGIPFINENFFHFIKAAQFSVAALVTVTLPLIYFLLLRLFRQRLVAGIATVLIALDPFLIGYSRVAHVDALLAHFLFIAALCSMLYVREDYRRGWLLASGITTALALLTKVPAIFVLPFLGLLVLTNQPPTALRAMAVARARDLTIWLLVVVVLFVMLWPAMLWVPDPKGNALVLKRDISWAATTPHDAVEDYSLNVWHYPAALLSRSTPVTLVGTVAAAALLCGMAVSAQLRSTRSFLPRGEVRVWWWTVAYIFFFVVMMTLGAKKGDRYILPVWPTLDLLTAGFLAYVVAYSRSRLSLPSARRLVAALVLSLVLVSAGTVWRYHPYALAYSNPLFPDNLSQELGWGEGLDQVAAWLNEHAPASDVASWYPQELGAFTTARVAHINAHEQGKIQYIVLYHNMFGRPPEHYANDFIDEYFKKRDPVFVAHVAGKEYAWVYEKRVYERVIGELTPDIVVRQQIEAAHPAFAGFDLLLANYSGRATAGDLVVRMLSPTGEQLQAWSLPVHDIEDNRWQSFVLDRTIAAAPTSFTVEVRALGTAAHNAPTLRYTDAFNYRLSDMQVRQPSDPDFIQKQGDIGLRLRYERAGQRVTEDETRLLR